MMKTLAFLALLASCGSSKEEPETACASGCLQGWWTMKVGTCSAHCILTPQPTECAATDCEAVDFYHVVDSSFVRINAIHSPSQRSLTLFTKADGTLTIPSACHLTLNATSDPQGSEFTCSETMVDLPARDWLRGPDDLVGRVAGATATTFPTRVSY